jgi:hypothetical protein
MSAKDSHNGVSLVHHHPDYYLKDGNITFLVRYTFPFISLVLITTWEQVQDMLFRVHRHFFETESQFFVKEFAKAPQEGSSDSSAFRLDKVSIADFAKFLWVWYSP